jgi:hypothetical protein
VRVIDRPTSDVVEPGTAQARRQQEERAGGMQERMHEEVQEKENWV